jgi:hypothetical protein
MSKNLKEIVKKLEFKKIKFPSWYNYELERAKTGGGVEILRKGKYYYYREGEEFRCLECDSTILSYNLYHSVNRSIQVNLGLTTQAETVPFCPKCEPFDKNEEAKEINYKNEPGLNNV